VAAFVVPKEGVMPTKYAPRHSTGRTAKREQPIIEPRKIMAGTILGATALGCVGILPAAFASPTKDDNAPLTQADYLPLPEPDDVTYDDTVYDPATMTPAAEGDGLDEFLASAAAGHPEYIADKGGSKGVEPEIVEDSAPIVEVEPPIVEAPLLRHDWTRVAECESGGDWHINTGNGYSGGLQFSPPTWDLYGGQEFAPFAHLATPTEQMIVAERVLYGYNGVAGQGIGAWPTCGQYLDDAVEPAPVATPAPAGEVTVRQLTNAARVSAGCDPLEVDWNLVASAQRHADWMAQNGRLEHSELGGGVAAENIAQGYDSAQSVTEGWMDSAGHRENMLNCDYTHMGLGWADGYWVQQFSQGEVAPAPAPVVSNAQGAVDAVMPFVGSTPYVWGGTSPSGWDCSGMVQWAYAQIGITHIGRTTYDHINAGWSVPLNALMPGDILITNGGGHEVMYIGNGQVVQAQRPGTLTMITPLQEIIDYYGVVDARRVI
jgi:cell wall-associated NlpC family hydrolase